MLSNEILDAGRSKAYYHAANYVNKLIELDHGISNYQRHENLPQYIRSLQDKHWRKRSFWEKAGYPNKAVS